jgi:hypothetical protein
MMSLLDIRNHQTFNLAINRSQAVTSLNEATSKAFFSRVC